MRQRRRAVPAAPPSSSASSVDASVGAPEGDGAARAGPGLEEAGEFGRGGEVAGGEGLVGGEVEDEEDAVWGAGGAGGKGEGGEGDGEGGERFGGFAVEVGVVVVVVVGWLLRRLGGWL